jgi:tetratricopeptide (TPR) repeat protein
MGWLDRRLGVTKRALIRRAMVGSPQETALRAQAMWQMGRPEAAISLLEPAMASFPESGVLYEAAAIAYGKSERFEDAIAAARRALAFNPSSAKLQLLLAFKLGEANRPREALAPALAALRLEPDNSSAHMAVSEASRRCGDRDQALRHAQEALRLNGDRHPALMGRVLLLHERWEQAETALRRGYAGHPDAWDGCFYLALALIPQGRCEEAKAMAEAFLARRPDDKVVPLLWERLERWQQREVGLREAVSSAMGSPARRARVELATLLVSQDRVTEAAGVMRAVLANDPHDEDARARLDEIEQRTVLRGSGQELGPPAMMLLENELRDEYQRRRIATQQAAGGAQVPSATVRVQAAAASASTS